MKMSDKLSDFLSLINMQKNLKWKLIFKFNHGDSVILLVVLYCAEMLRA